MNLLFTLTMPNVGSWNGKWSGEGSLYAVVRKCGTAKKTRTRLEPLIGRSFHYSFGDGWGANVVVSEIDGAEARRIAKQSKGFCGYEWMIDELVANGRIMTLAERMK